MPHPPHHPAIKVLIIPGLRNSGPAHWQTWLASQYADALRVEQDDWETPDLDAWSARIDDTVHQAQHSGVRWIAVAHSFGCLALADHLRRSLAPAREGRNQLTSPVHAALMVAPADPLKFDLVSRLPAHPLGIPLHLIGSENDPWMPLDRARAWAATWRAVFQNLGKAGHINVESGFGAWPLARHKVDQMIRLQQTPWRPGSSPIEAERQASSQRSSTATA